MTEHWNPINNNWSKDRYEDRLESVNDEVDRASGSKLSGDANVQHKDIEQLSYENDNLGQSQPQREPVEVRPGSFGGYGMDLVQDSDLKNGSEDMVSRVPPTCYDMNKLKSAAPPSYQEIPSSSHEKDVEFFGDSHFASRGSRSTLDQDSLHRGYISTLPSAGQRRGSASASSRRESTLSTNQRHEINQERRSSTSSTHKSQERKSSLVDMAVDAVATVGAGAAAAASGVSNALMGHNKPSPTEESKEMPSTWPDQEHLYDSRENTQTRHSSNESRSSHISEGYASQRHTSQSRHANTETHASGITGSTLNYGHNSLKSHSSFEPAIHGQNACTYTQDPICDEVTKDSKHPFCERVQEPDIRGQNPSYYGHDETVNDYRQPDISKARRWSEGWSRQNSSKASQGDDQDLLATDSSQAGKSRLDAQNAFQSKLDSSRTSQSSQSGASRRRSSEILGLTSSYMAGKLNVETITSSSLHAAQYGSTRRRSSNIYDSLLNHRLSTSSSTSYNDGVSTSSANSYSRAVRRESKLHEDYDQTLDHAPANNVKFYKGVLAAGGGGVVGSGLTQAQTLSQSTPPVDESEDDSLSSNSGLPPAWGDQPLPVPVRHSSDVAHDASATDKTKADTGSSINSAINSTNQAASSTSSKVADSIGTKSKASTSSSHASQFNEYDGIRVRGWNDNLGSSKNEYSDSYEPQDHGYSHDHDRDMKSKGVFATASAAALGALGGLGFGHRTSASHIETSDEKYHDSLDGSSDSVTVDKSSDHIAPKGWLSNADSATPPQTWHEVNQNLDSKGWADANRKLPSGTGHDEVNRGSRSGTMDNEKSALDYDTSDSEVDEKSSKGLIAGAAAAVGGLFGLHASHKEGAHEHGSSSQGRKENISQAINGPDQGNHDVQSIGGGRYEVHEANRFESVEGTHNKSATESRYDSSLDETRRSSKNPILGAAAAVGSALGLDHKNQRQSRDHSSEYTTSQETSASVIRNAANHTSQKLTTAPQTLSADVQDGQMDHATGSHQTSSKGAFSGAAATVGGILGLTHDNKESGTGLTDDVSSESHQPGIPSVRTKSVPTLPRDTTNATGQNQKQRITTAPQTLTGDSQEGDSDYIARESNDNRLSSTDSKSGGKGKIAGAAAAVGGILGLNHNKKESEQDLQSSDYQSTFIPSERTKSVPKIPSSDSNTFDKNDRSVSNESYSYNRSHNGIDEEKNISHGKSNKGIIAGATGAAGAAAASVGNKLGLSHHDKTSDIETQLESPQYEATQIPSVRTKDVPATPSKVNLLKSNKAKYVIPAERRKSIPGIKQYNQDDTTNKSSPNATERRRSSVEDNNSYMSSSHENKADQSKSGKGIIGGAFAGAAATVGSVLGSKSNSTASHQNTENEEYGISSYRTKSVPGIPSNSESRDTRQSSASYESGHNQLDKAIHDDRSESAQGNSFYSNSSSHDDHNKSGKGVISGATAAVGSALGLDHENSKVNTGQQGSAQPMLNQKYGIPSERTKSVPDTPLRSDNYETAHDGRHDSSLKSRQYMNDDDRYKYAQDNSKLTQDKSHRKSTKGALAGAAAAVGGAIGLENQSGQSETRQGQLSDSYNNTGFNQSTNAQDVTTAPQTLTGDSQYGKSIQGDNSGLYDHNRDSQSYKANNRDAETSRYSSFKDNSQSQNSSVKGAVAGAAAGVAGALGLNHHRKSTDSEYGYQGTYDYKKAPMTNERNPSINRDYYGGDNTQEADVRGSRYNNDHTLGADVRGSRYNNDHTSDADVRGSRFNSIQDDSRNTKSYDNNVRSSYDNGYSSGALGSGYVNNQSETGSYDLKKSAPGVPSKDYIQDSRRRSTYDDHNQTINDHRYVSVQGSGQNADYSHVIGSSGYDNQTSPSKRHNASSVTPQQRDVGKQDRNVDGYKVDESKADRHRSSSSKSGKGVIAGSVATVGGILGLNQSNKDKQSLNNETTPVSDGQYESSYYNAADPNKPKKKGAIAGTVGAAGAAAATVGGVLGIKNKGNEPGDASDVLRRQGSTADSLEGAIPNQVGQEYSSQDSQNFGSQTNQGDAIQANQANSTAKKPKFTYTTRSDRMFTPKLTIDDKPDQGYTTSKRNRETNSQQDQGFTTSQRDDSIRSLQYQKRVDSEVHPKVSDAHRASIVSNNSNKAAGVAALGGMLGTTMYDQSTSDKSQHTTKVDAQKSYYVQPAQTKTKYVSPAQTVPTSTQDSSYAQTIPSSTRNSSYAQKASTVTPNKSYTQKDISSQEYARNDTNSQDCSQSDTRTQSNNRTQDYSQSNSHRNSYAERNIESYARRNTGTQDTNYGLRDDKPHASDHNTGGAGAIAFTVAAAAATVGGALGLNSIDKKVKTHQDQGNDYQNTANSVNDSTTTNADKTYARDSTGTNMVRNAQKDYGYDDNMMSDNYNTDLVQDSSRANQMSDAYDPAYYRRDGPNSGGYSSTLDQDYQCRGNDSQDTANLVNNSTTTNADKTYARDSTGTNMVRNAQKDYGYDDNMMSDNYNTDLVQDSSRANQMSDAYDPAYYRRDGPNSGGYSSAENDQNMTTAPQMIAAENQNYTSTTGGQNGTLTSQGNSGMSTTSQTLTADNQYGNSTQATRQNDGYAMGGDQFDAATQDKTLNQGQSKVSGDDYHGKGLMAGAAGAVGAAAATVGGALGLGDKNKAEQDGLGKYDSSVKYRDHASQQKHSFPTRHDQEIRNAAQTHINDSHTTTKSTRTIPGSFNNDAGQNHLGIVTGTAVAGGATGAAIGNKLDSHQKATENWSEDNIDTIHRGQNITAASKNDNIGDTPPQSLANDSQKKTSPITPQHGDQTMNDQSSRPRGLSTQNGITSGGLGAAGIAGATGIAGASALGSKNNTSESISSTRATTGKIIPDTRQQEIKDRHHENFKNTPNSIDNLNNPKRRNNSVTQGLRSKFSNAVRRLSGQSGGSSGDRRLSDAEVYKNQQQAADYQQLAFGNNQQAFGGGSAFGNVATVIQEHRQSVPDNHQEPRSSVHDNHHPLNGAKPNSDSRLEHIHTETSPIHESHEAPRTHTDTIRRVSPSETSSVPLAAAGTIPINENGNIYRAHQNGPMANDKVHKAQHIEPTTAYRQKTSQVSNSLRDGQPLDHFKHNTTPQDSARPSDSLSDGQPSQHVKNNTTDQVQNSGIKQNYARAPGVYNLKPVGTVNVGENGEVNMIKVKEGTKAVKRVIKADGVPIKNAAEISAYHAQ